MSTQLESLRRYVAQRPASERGGERLPVLVLGSGKGGVGTSTLSALVALVAAAQDRRVLLVDADAGLGSLPMLLGAGTPPGLGALRGSGVDPQELLIPVAETLTLLPGGGTDQLTQAERQLLFRRSASLYPRFDLVVVDGGSRLDSVLAACGAGVARVLTVTTADRIAVAATYALIKVLGERFSDTPVDLIINREDADTARQVTAEISAATRHFLRREVRCCGAIPDDHSLRAALQAGLTLQEAAADSPIATAVQQINSTLLQQLTAAMPALVERPLLRRS